MAGKDTLRENALRKVKAKERATKETMSGVLEISEQDTSTSFKPELCPSRFKRLLHLEFCRVMLTPCLAENATCNLTDQRPNS